MWLDRQVVILAGNFCSATTGGFVVDRNFYNFEKYFRAGYESAFIQGTQAATVTLYFI